MPHGLPDYGLDAAKETVYGLADLGELAARQKSIVTFDRRGDIIWLDDFESSLNKWEDRGVDLGHDAAISNAYARNGAFSCKLTCGRDGDFEGIIHTYKPPPVLSKVGLEVHWTRPGTSFISIYFRLEITHGAKSWDARIRFLSATATLQYWDGAVFRDIEAGVGVRANHLLFSPLKFVIDLDGDVYSRLILHHRSWDLSSYAVPTGGGGALRDTRISILAVGATGVNTPLYIDDVILTQNEP